jgi:hypothetical protein
MRDADIRELVRQLLAQGQLPSHGANSVCASYGRGEVCRACGKPMTESAVVYEISVGSGDDATSLALHLLCYEAWVCERPGFSQNHAGIADPEGL